MLGWRTINTMIRGQVQISRQGPKPVVQLDRGLFPVEITFVAQYENIGRLFLVVVSSEGRKNIMNHEGYFATALRHSERKNILVYWSNKNSYCSYSNKPCMSKPMSSRSSSSRQPAS